MCKAISSSAHSFAITAPNSSSEIAKNAELQSRIKSKPIDQSTSASRSILPKVIRIYNQKESARFGLERPVDAHFRFRFKSAPTPNDAEPRLHIRIVAA